MINTFRPKKLPSILYKYRDWNTLEHKRLITHQELYFPSPSVFNDPFDGNIPIRWDLMSYEDCFHKNLTLVEAYAKKESKGFQINFAERLTKSKELFHPEIMKCESEEQLEKWNKTIGLASFSKTKDNILMWSHYANNHKGFVVGLDTKSLIRDHDFDYIDRMEYLGKYPIIRGTDISTERFRKKKILVHQRSGVTRRNGEYRKIILRTGNIG